MSWFRGENIAKIKPRNYYYYVTPTQIKAGIFKIYSPTQVVVTTEEIKKPPSGEDQASLVHIIPRSFINNLNPSLHFVLKTLINMGTSSYHFDSFLLGDILNKTTLGCPEYLSHAIISSNEPTIDLGDSLLIVPSMIRAPIPKFKDEQIIEKLTKSMNDAVFSARSRDCPNFTFDNGKEGPEKITVVVSVSLIDELKENLVVKEFGIARFPSKSYIDSPESKSKDEGSDELNSDEYTSMNL